MNTGSSAARVRLPRRVLVYFAVIILALIGVVASAPPARAADSAPYRANVFTRGYDSAPVVTLTFDADWSNAGIASVLQLLQANGIRAGFALTGRFVQTYPADARAIVAAGHRLINHSYDHPYFTDLTQAQRWSQLDRAEAAYKALGLTSAGWFRAPYKDGYADLGVNRDLALRGYYINFDWTYDTTGYLGVPQATILDRVRRYTVPGAIVVMHPGAGSTDPAALPAVISTLRGMGYTFTSPQRAVTRGAIRTKYLALGGETSVHGAPRTAEMVATTSGTAVQWFQYGRIYYSAATGAHVVYGGILNKYRSLGTVTSFLRFPLTDELAVTGGRLSRFQGGEIYYSSATGAHEVHGGILNKFRSLGGVDSFLRFPATDELAVTGGRASRFQGGHIYWSSATGAHEVHGGILSRYLALGGPGSRLGLPVTDEYATSTGQRSDFQHGSILWNRTTHIITVIYT